MRPAFRRGWLVVAVGLIGFARPCGPADAGAGEGQRMLRIVCDDNSGLVTVEPFVLWDGSRAHGSDRLIDPQLTTRQNIGIYYRIDDDLAVLPVVHDCAVALRKVTVAEEGQESRISETVGGHDEQRGDRSLRRTYHPPTATRLLGTSRRIEDYDSRWTLILPDRTAAFRTAWSRSVWLA